MAARYQNVYFMGTGKVAIGCLDAFLQYCALNDDRKYKPFVVEYGASSFSLSFLKSFAAKRGVAYISFEKRSAQTREYYAAVTEPSLIVSVNNSYIFPEELCEKSNLTIINNHSALLPKYPGIHAQTWAIFHDEPTGGITWHYVDAGVDSGDLISQASAPIPPDCTALALCEIYNGLTISEFSRIIGGVLDGTAPRIPQDIAPDRRVYRLSDLPNDGFVDIDDDITRSYRILRSMDYGRAGLMPGARLTYQNQTRRIVSYRFTEKEPQQRTRVVFDENGSMLSVFENGNMLDLRLQ